jgi:hypothetical protein
MVDVKLYQLLWTLIKHGLHGRFRDDVCVSVLLKNEVRTIGLTGVIVGLDPVGKGEDFCVIAAVSEDLGPYTEHPSFPVEAS